MANNHVLDWGYAGLIETLDTLKAAEIDVAGAGRNLAEAQLPAIREVPGKGRVIVFAFGMESSGIPPSWRAKDKRPGINRLSGLNDISFLGIRQKVAEVKRERDVIVASIHWESNWGYPVPAAQIDFAHRLIDEAGIDIDTEGRLVLRWNY